MKNKEKVIQAIYSAVGEVNRLLPKDLQIDKSPDFVIIGKSGKLDSLGLVNLTVAIEEKIEDEFRLTLTLLDEKTLSESNSPLKTIGTLADYICSLLEEEINDKG